jgi:hypothetical protein
MQPYARLPVWAQLETLHSASDEQVAVLVAAVLNWEQGDSTIQLQPGARDMVLGMAGNGKSALCRLAKHVAQCRYGDLEGVVVSTAPTNAAVENVAGVRSLESLLWVAYKWQSTWAEQYPGRDWPTERFVEWMERVSFGRVREWVTQMRVLIMDELGMLHPKLFAALMHLIDKYNPRVHVLGGADFHQLVSFVENKHEGAVCMPHNAEFVFEVAEFRVFRLFLLHEHMRGDRIFYQYLCRIGRGLLGSADIQYWSQESFKFKAAEWDGLPYTLVTTERAKEQAENGSKWKAGGGEAWQLPWQFMMGGDADRTKFTDKQLKEACGKCLKDVQHTCNYPMIDHIVPGGFCFKIGTRVLFGWKSECRIVRSCGPGPTDFEFLPGEAVSLSSLKGKQGEVVGHMWPSDGRSLHGSKRLVALLKEHRQAGHLQHGFPVVKVVHNGQVLHVLVQYNSFVQQVHVPGASDNIPIECSVIPLRFGWATTVHSTQSCTLDYVLLNLKDDFFFAFHLLYVMMSRVRGPQCLRFLGGFQLPRRVDISVPGMPCVMEAHRLHPKVAAFYNGLQQVPMGGVPFAVGSIPAPAVWRMGQAAPGVAGAPQQPMMAGAAYNAGQAGQGLRGAAALGGVVNGAAIQHGAVAAAGGVGLAGSLAGGGMGAPGNAGNGGGARGTAAAGGVNAALGGVFGEGVRGGSGSGTGGTAGVGGVQSRGLVGGGSDAGSAAAAATAAVVRAPIPADQGVSVADGSARGDGARVPAAQQAVSAVGAGLRTPCKGVGARAAATSSDSEDDDSGRNHAECAPASLQMGGGVAAVADASACAAAAAAAGGGDGGGGVCGGGGGGGCSWCYA